MAQLPDVIKVVDHDERSGSTNEETGLERHSSSSQKSLHLSAIEEGDEEKGNTNNPRSKEQDEIPAKDSSKKRVSPSPITELPVFYKAPDHDYRVMAMSVLWLSVFSIIGFADSIDGSTKELIVGTVTNFCLVFFYGAPLSCIAIVLKTRNTATLHVPTMFTNTLSSLFWGIYGLAVLDFFVAVPNLLGAMLGVIQIALYMMYPRVETNTVPVITAAIPAPGANVDDGNSTTEMEVIQMQLHDVTAGSILGQSGMMGNTNAGDMAHNPINIEYAFPNSLDDNYTNVTTLLKQEITMDGITDASTENPLILQYAENSSNLSPEGASLEASNSRIGTLHRRASSRGAGRLGSFGEGADPGSSMISTPTTATVASVHHKRVISDTDTSFLAGLFASDRDLLNVDTTTTATLHRRFLSSSTPHQD